MKFKEYIELLEKAKQSFKKGQTIKWAGSRIPETLSKYIGNGINDDNEEYEKWKTESGITVMVYLNKEDIESINGKRI